MNQGEADFLIIGGGIAGISAGAWLARRGRSIVLERESQPGYHATGRSAALYTKHYGNATIRALTRASGQFLKVPPDGFSSHPILSPRGLMFLARADQSAQLETMAEEIRSGGGPARPMTWPEAMAWVPVLAPGYGMAALLDPEASDIDVHALLQGYLRLFRGHGGVLVTDAEVMALERSRGRWHATTRAGQFAAPIAVNAGGAWVDALAALAGLPPLGVIPLRRSAMTIAAPAEAAVAGWPLVIDVEEQFYLKPDAGRLLLSPADETPSPPCDAQPEELDIALAVDRLEQATTIRVDRVLRRWAGLRSFAPDRTPIVGFDPLAEGFFWLAGQGGYGIQTSAALGRVAAALATGEEVPNDIGNEGVVSSALSPARLR